MLISNMELKTDRRTRQRLKHMPLRDNKDFFLACITTVPSGMAVNGRKSLGMSAIDRLMSIRWHSYSTPFKYCLHKVRDSRITHPMYTVIETTEFIQWAAKVWCDAERVEFINWIAKNPLSGDVITGTDSLRKSRNRAV